MATLAIIRLFYRVFGEFLSGQFFLAPLFSTLMDRDLTLFEIITPLFFPP